MGRHPTYHTARIALGSTYLESGDLENARTTLSEVLELAPENHLAGKLLAEVQRRLGDAAGAVKTYRSILVHYPADKEIETLLSDLLAAGEETQRHDAAVGGSAAEPALDYSPEDITVPPSSPARPPRALPLSGPASLVPNAAPPPPPSANAVPLVRVPESVASLTTPSERARAPIAPMGPGPVAAMGTGQPPRQPVSPAPGPPLATGGISEDELDALQTNTLAELYLRQGLVDRAMEVYRSMLRVDPGNGRARRRLDELAASAAAPIAGPDPSLITAPPVEDLPGGPQIANPLGGPPVAEPFAEAPVEAPLAALPTGDPLDESSVTDRFAGPSPVTAGGVEPTDASFPPDIPKDSGRPQPSGPPAAPPAGAAGSGDRKVDRLEQWLSGIRRKSIRGPGVRAS